MPRPQVNAARSAGEEAPRARSDKRSLILEAAIKVFATHGYHRARVSDIAREAGIAYGLVYHYFKNKDEILATIFEERWAAFLDALEGIERGPGTVEQRLVSIAALILNAYRIRPDWVKVLVFEIQRSSRFAEPGQLRAVGRLFEVVERLLVEGQRLGELRRDVDASLACTAFIGALELMITSLVLGVTRIEGDEEAARAYYLNAARTVVEIFVRGAGSEGVA